MNHKERATGVTKICCGDCSLIDRLLQKREAVSIDQRKLIKDEIILRLDKKVQKPAWVLHGKITPL